MENFLSLDSLENPIFLLIILWTLPWKGIALWKAAQRNDKWWFIALFVVNTVAILEILYILIWSKRPPNNTVENPQI